MITLKINGSLCFLNRSFIMYPVGIKKTYNVIVSLRYMLFIYKRLSEPIYYF